MKRLAWLSVAVTVGLLVTALAMARTAPLIDSAPWIMTAVVFAACGALIITRRPNHPIGWLFSGMGFFSSMGFLLLSLSGIMGGSAAAAWSEAVGNALTTIGVQLISAALLRFPEGRLPSPRWKWASGLVLFTAATGALASLLNGGWGGDSGQAILESPLRAVTAPIGDVLSNVFYALLLLTMGAAGLSLVVRYQRATGVAREQMKWLAVAATLLVAALTASLLTEGTAELSDPVITWVVAITFASVPAAVAIAIIRYRLYDIDRIINRTIVYGLATGAVLAVYAATVFAVSAIAAETANNLAVALATLLAAAAFRPALQRVQRFVDRRFYRRRFDVQTTIDDFGSRLSHGTNLDNLKDDLVVVVRSTMQPEQVGVWLRSGE
ncbi:MAG: hypothetical protein LC739_00180 [Actinobacteria bacterium]|nr:hypothetical protein [Actinomycetota bacterium]